MTAPVEILLWAPDRETFASTMASLTLPDGQHIAWLATEDEPGPEGGSIRTLDVILCSEIGPITKVPAVLDDEGNEITPAGIIPGYHVNMFATGWLADMLTAGLPAEGTLFERTRILGLLGTMNWQPSAVGEPAGYVGTSGVKISDPDIVNHRARVWALAA
jgi:hypothetical protein